MQILLTNDDGIYAPGLRKLHAQLKKIADVKVVAPDSERSSVGHGITLSRPLFLKEITIEKEFTGYGLSGTPADCVKLGLKTLLKSTPDLIVSGINLGPNDGHSIFYSGTVAGAREGALAGIPSIAFSLATFVNPHFEFASRMAVKLIKKIPYKEFPSGTFLNINIPNVMPTELQGVRVTQQGLTPIHTKFIKKSDPFDKPYFWMTGDPPNAQNDALKRDTTALAENYISITPIQADATDVNFYNQILKWKF